MKSLYFSVFRCTLSHLSLCSFISLPELKLGINAGSLKALRAARVLRPLKLVSGIPSK